MNDEDILSQKRIISYFKENQCLFFKYQKLQT